MLPSTPAIGLSRSSSPSTSIPSDYVDMSALSTQIGSLGERMTPILGNSSQDVNAKNKPKSSKKDTNAMDLSMTMPVYVGV